MNRADSTTPDKQPLCWACKVSGSVPLDCLFSCQYPEACRAWRLEVTGMARVQKPAWEGMPDESPDA